MYGVILVFHILVSIALIGIVLMQSGKGGGLAGGAFGGSAQTVFGGRGATDVVTRSTIVLGTIFFITSIVLALMTSGVGQGPRSLIQEEAQRAGQGPAPAPTPLVQPDGSTPAPAEGGGQAPEGSGGGQQPQGGGQ